MADNKPVEEDEKKIPVFTVLKNNSLLKNIFLLDNPPSPLEKIKNSNQEIEQILILGRHPDCTIMLTHPSISRFHLRIHSNPNSQKLSVVDLSSVHGTWVSDRKIEPGVKVELKDGDTVRIGGSSRVYKLYWVPMSKAYDMENMFLSSSDLSMMEEKEEELVDLEEDYVDENCQGYDSISVENKEFALIDSISEVVESLFSDEHLDYFVNKEVPSAPPIPDDFFDVECFLNQSLSENYHEQNKNLYPSFVPNATFAVNFSSPFEELMLGNEAEPQPLVISQAFSEIENPDIAPKLYELKANFENELDSLSLDEPEVKSPVTEVLEEFSLDSQTTTFENEAEAQPLVAEQVEYPESPPNRSELKSTYVDDLRSLSLAEPEVNSPVVEILGQVENLHPSFELATEAVNLSPPFGELVLDSEAETQPLVVAQVFSEIENPDIPPKIYELKSNFEDELDLLSLDEPEVSSPVTEVLEGFLFDAQATTCENDAEAQPPVGQILSEIENPESPPKTSELKSISLDDLNSLSLAEPELNTPLVKVYGQVENQTSVKSDYGDENWSGTLRTKAMNLSLPRNNIHVEIENEQFEGENHTTTSPHATDEYVGTESSESSLIRSDPKLSFSSIWSRRGKPASAIQIQTGRVKEHNVNSKNAKTLCFGLDRDENANFTPDKENLTPNNLPLMPKKRKGKTEENKQLFFYNSSPLMVAASPSSGGEDKFGYSDKENQTPKVLQEQTSARSSSTNRVRLTSNTIGAERVPFQSVILNSDAKSKSETSVLNAYAKSSSSVNSGKSIEKRTNLSSNNNAARDRKRKWYMVVDIASLLNKESRKALQLLQGLKGTQLIIPKMVLRELECLKQRASMFRRMSGVSSVLQWIEECMVSTDWWIHVQSSSEEGLAIAPTPLALPEFSSTKNSELFSPTAEDHSLEIALLYRRLKNDGQLVLLSNDVTLKIKAMAEGVICETAEEFRESLVNPFSDRFLWAESSPRGLTWSCEDDVVLRENYYSCPLKKATSVKGLKLILLHNSHYSKTSNYF